MAHDSLIGFQNEQLRFERLLGKGAMGEVYQGTQLLLNRTVAIKVIAPRLADDVDYITRFTREARTLGKLIHPHVIACHDVGPTPGPEGRTLQVMVLEYIDGWSLGDLMHNKQLTVRQVLELLAQAAEGLAAAHRMGIIHRDIKPDNIMVAREGIAKLADFGLAKLVDSALLTQSGMIIGSPAYMSPEACSSEELSPRSDIYSLGCTLFHVITGQPPYNAAKPLVVLQKHLQAPVPVLSAHRPDLQMLDPLVKSCLAKHTNSRPADADLLSKSLRQIALLVPGDALSGVSVVAASKSGIAFPVPSSKLNSLDQEATTRTRRPQVQVQAHPQPAGRIIGRTAFLAITTILAVILLAIILMPNSSKLHFSAAASSQSDGLDEKELLQRPTLRSDALWLSRNSIRGWMPPTGFPGIPARIPPYAQDICLSKASTRHPGKQELHLQMPPNQQPGKASIIITINGGTGTRMLHTELEMRGVLKPGPSLALTGEGWQTAKISLSEVTESVEGVILTSDGDARLALACAVFTNSDLPTIGDIAIPGTLLPLKAESGWDGEMGLHALLRLCLVNPDFPDQSKVLISCPQGWQSLAFAVLQMFSSRNGLPTTPAQPSPVNAYGNEINFPLETVFRAPEHAKEHFFILLLDAEHPAHFSAPALVRRCSTLAGAGTCPILILSTLDRSTGRDAGWSKWLNYIQVHMPGLAIIDLSEQPSIPVRPSPTDVWNLGLAAGLHEFKQRMDWQLKASGIRRELENESRHPQLVTSSGEPASGIP